MGIEIERKFLVEGDVPEGAETRISQAYLSAGNGLAIRVRLEDGQGTLTIKGKAREGRFTRAEFEYPVPADDVQALMTLAAGYSIEKIRRRIAVGEHTWEVDFFSGFNEGLVVAEIELGSEDEAFVLPEWVGEEVTGNPRYSNSSLARTPYSTWKPS
ncbi:MAG: CYTH domain-containing protein [bacterium]